MSSMLKKSGGLAFKPKIKPNPRRGAPAPPAKPTSTPSNNLTNAPNTESSSQSSTPGPAPIDASSSTPVPAPSSEISKDIPHEPNTQPTSASGPAPVEPSIVQPAPDSAALPTPPATALSQNNQPDSTASRENHDREQQRQTLERTRTPIAQSKSSVTKAPVSTEPAHPPTTSQAQAKKDSAVSAPPTRPCQAPPSTQTTAPKQSGASSRQSGSSAAESSATASEGIVSETLTNDEASTTAPAPRKKRAYKKRQPPAAENTGDATVISEPSAPKKKRAHRKRPQPTETPAEQSDGPSPTEAESGTTSQPSKRRKRSVTPEDAEERQVDHSIMKVGDLTKDLRIGKKFKHADAIAQRAKEARARQRQKRLEKQQRRLGLLPDDAEDNATESRDDSSRNRATSSAGPNSASMDGDFGAGDGVGYEVVDGQIVVNQQSLVVDRHAANQDMSSMVTVEEDDFTHLTTSHTYLRESRNIGSNSWTDDETEKFYRYLQMFGTDFETISHMFPGKQRRHVKLKFNREERLRPKRVNAAIMVRGQKTTEIDIDEYKGYRKNWEETDKIQQEQDLLAQEHRKEVRRLRAERRAQGLADDGSDDDDENNDDKPKEPGGKGDESAKNSGGNADAAEKTSEPQSEDEGGVEERPAADDVPPASEEVAA